VKGRIKEEVGEMSDDERLRNEGEADQVAGKVQDTIGRGRRKVGETIEDLGENLKR
jgi:uncharacterized protein YjbJ (UPF0337 family)